MAKSERKTRIIAWVVYAISVLAFLATTIIFIHWYFTDYSYFLGLGVAHKPSDHDMYVRYYATSFLAYFLTGQGIMMFRVTRKSMPIVHGLLHTVILAILVFDRIDDTKEKYPITRRFPHSWDIALGMYVLQFIGSFHFMVFRIGLTESETQCRTGIHAFIGVLTFIVLILDVFIRIESIAMEEVIIGQLDYDWQHIAMSMLALIYAMCVLYIILMPRYEWKLSKAKFECFLPGKIRNKRRSGTPVKKT